MENLPNGEARPVLDIVAESGAALTGTRSGNFNQSRGFIYREGKKALRFEAPSVDASEEKQTVIATGRVKVWSVDPPGGTVEADRATWYIQKNKIVAEGNVTMTFHPADPSKPSMSLGPVRQLQIDTELKHIEVP
jgi:lipopolysaccharide assembly outer membrane protein LptD (OstA)